MKKTYTFHYQINTLEGNAGIVIDIYNNQQQEFPEFSDVFELLGEAHFSPSSWVIENLIDYSR